MKLLAVFLPFILLLNIHVSCQNMAANTEFSFMFYNAENFFDCENDSITSDDEFTPDGDRRWNYGRLHSKTERLAKVILAAGKWNSPILVGLCEIENSTVLELLTKSKILSQHNYKIVHKDSPDERGIDVALIYRSEFFRPFDYQAIPLIDPDDRAFKTRDILHVSGVLNGCDTLHVFVNHWPSRYGGIMETIKYRRLAAETLNRSIQAILVKKPLAKIVCMGDFNDSPKDESLAKVLGAKSNDDLKVSGEMINLSSGWLSNNVLTIKSQYTWEVFDQWIVSDSFLGNTTCYKFLKAEIFSPDFLLESDQKFGGVKPKRTYVGFKFQEGFSDHLPVLLRVQLNGH